MPKTKTIAKRDLRYFEENRNGNEVAFSTTFDETSSGTYKDRLGSVNWLIAAGYLETTPARDSGVCLWYRILRTPTAKNVSARR